MDEYKEEEFLEDAIVEVQVTVQDKKVHFEPTLDATRQHILQCLKAIIDHNKSIPRVERLLFPGKGLQHVYYLIIFILVREMDNVQTISNS